MTNSDNSSFYPVVRVINSLLMMTIAMSGMYASIMVLEPATREFDIGRGAGALPFTMYMIGFGLGNIMLGGFMDRFGFARLSLAGAMFLPAGLYLASISSQLWTFTFSLAVFCGFLGGGFCFGPLVADISHWFEKRRGLAVGIVISGSYVAGAIWPPVLQGWIDDQGWRDAFADLALICLLTMIPLSLVYLKKRDENTDEEPESVAHRWEQPLGLGKRRLQGLLCLAGIGCCAAMAMPQIHIVPHVTDLGFRPIDGAYMLGLMMGFGVISRVSSGWLSDRIGGLKTLILGSGLQAMVIAVFLVVDTLTGLYVASIAFGLAQGGIVPAYTIIIRRHFRPEEAGRRIGLAFVATTGGMALGGWMAGILYDLSGSYTLSFLNAIAFNILNLGIAGYLLLQHQRIATPATEPA